MNIVERINELLALLAQENYPETIHSAMQELYELESKIMREQLADDAS